jgi:hypothetical protein
LTTIELTEKFEHVSHTGRLPFRVRDQLGFDTFHRDLGDINSDRVHTQIVRNG